MPAGKRLLFCLLLLFALSEPAAARETLPVLARVGPWPVISRIVAYDGRLWFANSVKGRNHNSADLYSLDPAAGAPRYERHLFSQDAGWPLVFAGRLYWPFEDPRMSLGWGHYQVTDGETWRLGVIPTGQAFHAHALAELDGALVAASSAWRASFQRSGDQGASWQEIYHHPTPEGRVSRIVALWPFRDGLAAHLIRRGEERAVLWRGAALQEVPGWPRGKRILGLTVWRDRLYGLVREEGGVALWSSDGTASESKTLPPGNWRALASDGESLWTLRADEAGGSVWSSADGENWHERRSLSGGLPQEITFAGGRLFVAGAGADGRGVLWGEAGPLTSSPSSRPFEGVPQNDQAIDWHVRGDALDAALADPASYAGRERLRDLIFEAARAGAPRDFFTGRLEGPFPDRDLGLIGGAVTVSATKLARWLLLWGTGVAGQGHVPLAFLSEAWAAPENRSEKYFETSLMALWAAAQTGQSDRETLAVLIERLSRDHEPLWLRGQAVGALTAVTGQRFGYVAEAWKGWFEGQGRVVAE